MNRIQQELKKQGRSIKWLSGKTGISYSSVGDYCRNTRQPKKAYMIAIAKVLEVNVSDIEGKDVFEQSGPIVNGLFEHLGKIFKP